MGLAPLDETFLALLFRGDLDRGTIHGSRARPRLTTKGNIHGAARGRRPHVRGPCDHGGMWRRSSSFSGRGWCYSRRRQLPPSLPCPQMFSEHLLYARGVCGNWEYSNKQNKPLPTWGLCSEVGRQANIKETNTPALEYQIVIRTVKKNETGQGRGGGRERPVMGPSPYRGTPGKLVCLTQCPSVGLGPGQLTPRGYSEGLHGSLPALGQPKVSVAAWTDIQASPLQMEEEDRLVRSGRTCSGVMFQENLLCPSLPAFGEPLLQA